MFFRAAFPLFVDYYTSREYDCLVHVQGQIRYGFLFLILNYAFRYAICGYKQRNLYVFLNCYLIFYDNVQLHTVLSTENN